MSSPARVVGVLLPGMPAVLLFPGQTSFAPTMLREAAEAWPTVAAEVVDEAGDALGRDLRPWLEGIDGSRNRDLQIAVFVTSHVHLRALDDAVRTNAGSVGHSLGEYNHLVHIGALGFPDAVRLVAARGEAYDDGPEGMMAAVFPLEREALEPLVAVEAEAWIAAINGPSQHVVAGEASAVRRVLAAAEEATFANAVVIEERLPMHCPRFAGVAEAFEVALRRAPWRRAHGPWIPNVTGVPVFEPGPAQLVELLVRHVREPVQWRRCVDAACEVFRPAFFVEVGHGHGLTGLLRREWRAEPRARTSDRDGLAEVLDAAR
ncbi:MAG: ACP S-malonyltransferase [Alphaproteobacteria bacterium]|nr:ACP S-malonyltransferase [Alphaproteobacteria bacterium]